MPSAGSVPRSWSSIPLADGDDDHSASPSRRRRKHIAVALVSGVLVVALGACSDDPDLDPGPPAPPQATSSSPTPGNVPLNGPPVITIGIGAEQYADDDAISGFEEYARAGTYTFQNPGEGEVALFAALTGRAEEAVRAELEEMKENGWRLVGTPTWEIVAVELVDETHRKILTCEHDSSSYPVDRNGVVVRPFKDRWLPNQHWMVFADGKWILEGAYAGEHVCEEV